MVVLAGDASGSGSSDVRLTANSYPSSHPAAVLVSGFKYNPAGVIHALIPPTGAFVGGTVLTIVGSNLNNGTDLTAVFVCQVPAFVLSFNQTVVTVVTQRAATPGLALCSCSPSRTLTQHRLRLLCSATIPVRATRVDFCPSLTLRCSGFNFVYFPTKCRLLWWKNCYNLGYKSWCKRYHESYGAERDCDNHSVAKFDACRSPNPFYQHARMDGCVGNFNELWSHFFWS